MPEQNNSDSRRIGELISAGAAWLASRQVEEARLSCEWLAASVLGLTRTELEDSFNLPAPDFFVSALRNGILRLGANEPVQYVIGEWDFRSLTLKTDRRALIPRPETEQLVQLVLDTGDLWRGRRPLLCDVGTGTGCIAISLVTERPDCDCVATDIEAAAISLASENARLCGADSRISFVRGRNFAGMAAASLDAVVSNPPYIASSVCDSLPPLIREFEPRSALDGGPDGLDIIRDLVHDSAITLRQGGWCFLEIGDDQGEAVGGILEDAGFSDIAVLVDYAGKTRFAKGRID